MLIFHVCFDSAEPCAFPRRSYWRKTICKGGFVAQHKKHISATGRPRVCEGSIFAKNYSSESWEVFEVCIMLRGTGRRPRHRGGYFGVDRSLAFPFSIFCTPTRVSHQQGLRPTGGRNLHIVRQMHFGGHWRKNSPRLYTAKKANFFEEEEEETPKNRGGRNAQEASTLVCALARRRSSNYDRVF